MTEGCGGHFASRLNISSIIRNRNSSISISISCQPIRQPNQKQQQQQQQQQQLQPKSCKVLVFFPFSPRDNVLPLSTVLSACPSSKNNASVQGVAENCSSLLSDVVISFCARGTGVAPRRMGVWVML